MRVLLVDDDRAVLTGLRRAFALEGYEVSTAEDGDDALDLAAQFQPELVVLDVLLPGLDGFTVCERLRRQMSSSVPILVLSAKDSVLDRIAGLDHGADDYLVKPFSIDELLARCEPSSGAAHSPSPLCSMPTSGLSSARDRRSAAMTRYLRHPGNSTCSKPSSSTRARPYRETSCASRSGVTPFKVNQILWTSP